MMLLFSPCGGYMFFFLVGLSLGQGVHSIVPNVANKLHYNCEKLLPDMIMFDSFLKV